ERLGEARSLMGDDFWSYGVASNRKTLETFLRHHHAQGLSSRLVSVEEMFHKLTPQFERQSGNKVEYVFAVMSSLRDRLAAGEKADVLVMPTNILDGYQKDNVVRAQCRAVLGLVGVN